MLLSVFSFAASFGFAFCYWIEIEQRQAWGLHRISGGFVNAEFDYVEDDKIYITLTDGIQSDCQNTTNVTHVSLWRDNLEWTD